MDTPHTAERDTHRAGMLYCAAELSARGWDVSLTGADAVRYDLLAVRQRHAVDVRCATAKSGLTVGPDFEQPLEEHVSDREWVVFVTLRLPGQRPVFYVVPRRVAATVIWCSARHAVSGRRLPGRASRPVTLEDFRRFREAWNRLTVAPGDVPWLIDLDRPFWRWADQVPVPDRLARPVTPDETTFHDWERRRAAICTSDHRPPTKKLGVT